MTFTVIIITPDFGGTFFTGIF